MQLWSTWKNLERNPLGIESVEIEPFNVYTTYKIVWLQETRCFDALAELYKMLNEEDVRYGLWKRRTITPDTRAGLSLIQHGFWQRAQEVFYNAINKARQVHILIMERIFPKGSEFYLEFSVNLPCPFWVGVFCRDDKVWLSFEVLSCFWGCLLVRYQ
jgi:hypothetical protein